MKRNVSTKNHTENSVENIDFYARVCRMYSHCCRFCFTIRNASHIVVTTQFATFKCVSSSLATKKIDLQFKWIANSTLLWQAKTVLNRAFVSHLNANLLFTVATIVRLIQLTSSDTTFLLNVRHRVYDTISIFNAHRWPVTILISPLSSVMGTANVFHNDGNRSEADCYL